MTVASPCDYADKQDRSSARSPGRYHEDRVIRSIWTRHDLVSKHAILFSLGNSEAFGCVVSARVQ
jgi:hypothetical protein